MLCRTMNTDVGFESGRRDTKNNRDGTYRAEACDHYIDDTFPN